MGKSTALKILATLSGFLGMAILSYTLYPLADYELTARQSYPTLLSPLPDSERFPDLSSEYDLTQASNWFPGGAKKEDFVASQVSYYTISIPRLKIENATVAIGGEDLSKSLVQYPGTALPGKNGNTVIFGHSILPIFYDPKDYLAIFSTLPTLKKGDKIEVNYDGVTYKYQVTDLFEVLPDELDVLTQDSSNSYISLITCVPPGHPLKPRRLVVRAKIVPFN
ncbi:hypothetical protein A2V56_05200 [Candidatus Woesebacteria bacterium RBG_19FT_COMBO_42_9]|uniref:Sortase n=1 Tax=Candidatus Woesebacteria bacterium RBG_16_42_24 TaxID=1802485 RepID=A0A1F7XLM1_9BACT|nr:MAG: hypothetical protein A2V97_03940 [Candidatus Woesebacteria bacterium RBG_16_42_24]OGM17278.1 MAG: hypothetical protein A2V56_05200 [Candidatus Woesebacteria bacterium RBG_19FT_COMBO_42_9]OGM68003.1 MAG: hypothetical protein A2985_00855 [Candidatus Woesebacteria bacterium RIFCSPLOWO2_01_FULL_43_11]